MSHPIRAYPVNGENHIAYPHVCSGCFATVVKLKHYTNGKWETWMVSIFIFCTQDHNILFTVLLQRKKLLHYLSFWWITIYRFWFLFQLSDRKSIACYCLSKSNSTSTWLAGICAHSPWDTSRDRDTQFPQCQVLSSYIKFFHNRQEEGCKSAFSILDFPSKQSLQSLCVCQWLVMCVEDSLILKLTFPQLQPEGSQKFNITDQLEDFVLPFSGFIAPSDPQYIQTRIRKASWAVCLFDQGQCQSSAQLPLVHLNKIVLQKKPL